MAQVNHRILIWARETAGLSIEDAANALNLGGARTPGPEALRIYESGEKTPTRPLLLKMAKTYRRPLLTFYLAKPPVIGDRGEDFRTLPEDKRADDRSAVDALVRDIYVRQRLVKEALEDGEEAIPQKYIGSLSNDSNIFTAAETISKHISFDLNEFRAKRNIEESFNYLRGLAENNGVFVLLIGNLGSHHSNISANAFRGFALADKYAPFIVINDQDAKSAWPFTLLHELTHLFLGQTGISGGRAEQRVEKLCNDVASQILLPQEDLMSNDFELNSINAIVTSISSFAGRRKVSSSMVAYRLWQEGRISKEAWESATAEFFKIWQDEKESKKKKVAKKSGAPDYYVVKRHKAGPALVSLIRRGVNEGIITPTKAGRVLGVSPGNVAAMVGLQ